jgi:hypothetical protein
MAISLKKNLCGLARPKACKRQYCSPNLNHCRFGGSRYLCVSVCIYIYIYILYACIFFCTCWRLFVFSKCSDPYTHLNTCVKHTVGEHAIYRYIYIYIYIYAHIHTYIYIYGQICPYIYAHIYIYVHIYICPYIYMYICKYNIYRYIYIYICICKQIYTNICLCVLQWILLSIFIHV